MADQLTALQIKIEADIESAIKKLDSLAATIQSVEKTVGTSVGNINRLLKSIDSKVVNIGVKVSGADQLESFAKKASGAAATGSPIGVNIDTNSIDGFVARVKAGVATSIEELKNFRKVTAQLYEQKKLKLGVDDTEVVELRKKLEFINGFIQAAQRQVKVHISSSGDQELRNKLNGLQKQYVLQIIPTFNDAEFNKLLEEVQNKRININFNDIETELQQRIERLEREKTLLPIGINNSQIDAEIVALNTKLTSIKTLRIAADATPAEQSLAETIRKVNTELAKQRELKLKAQITLPAAELSALSATKKRLEAEKLKITGKAEFGEVTANLESVKRRIAELNTQGVKLQVSTGELISQRSVANVEKTLALVKDLKRQGGQVRLDVQSSGLAAVNAQASQTIRNFEQIIRDSPSFAISAQQGFIAISNNIGPLTDSFGRLAAEAKASGQGIGAALKGAIGGWNGIGIAISVAVTAVAVFSKELFGASKETSRLKSLFEEIKEILDNTKFVTPTAAVSKTGEETRVKALAGLIETYGASSDTGSKALLRLKEASKEYFGDLKSETLTVNELRKATDGYVRSLSAQSIESSRINELNKVKEQQAKVDVEIIEAQRRLLVEREKFNRQGVQIQGVESRVVTEDEVPAIKELKGNLTTLLATQKELIITAAAYRNVISQDVESGLGNPFDDVEKGGKVALDLLQKYLSELKKLEELKLINLKFDNTKLIEAGKLSAVGLINAINSELSKENLIKDIDLQLRLLGVVDPATRALIVQQVEEERNLIEKQYGDRRLEVGIAVLDISEFQKSIEIIRTQIRDAGIAQGLNLKMDVAIPDAIFSDRINSMVGDIEKVRALLGQPAAGIEFWNSLLPDRSLFESEASFQEATIKRLTDLYKLFGGELEETNKRISDSWNQIAGIIAGTVADGVSDIIESFLEGTQTLKKFGQQLANIGKELVTNLIRLAAFQGIMAALGAGTGSIGTGFLFNFFKPRGLATGGIATGPTLAMVGEGRESEAVLPLSYLRGLIGGDAAPGGRLTAEVSMDSIIFGLERSMRRQGRSFGG